LEVGLRVAPKERFSIRQVMLPNSYSTFESDVAAIRDVGLSAMAIWSPKLGQGRDLEFMKLMRDSGVRASVCSLSVVSVLPEIYFGGPTDPTARVEAMCSGIERLAAFSPSGVVALTGGGEGRSAGEARRIVVNGLREVAATAAKYGITIGLEPVRYPEGTSLVSTMSDTVALVQEVGEDNLRIAYDVWHFWDSPSLLPDITKFGNLMNSVHIADWRTPPRGKMDRVLPGEGVIDLPRILAGLEAAGFVGWYELEVFSDNNFSDSILQLDERELFRRAWTGFSDAWARAGLGDETSAPLPRPTAD
jgi:sugar phosphate isomerase/epimerase